MREPWTRAELDALVPRVDAALRDTEAEFPDARPIGPMTTDECRDLLNRLMDHAANRPLTREEYFLHGQIQAAFEMAVRAATLGYKGRVFAVTEEQFRHGCGS